MSDPDSGPRARYINSWNCNLSLVDTYSLSLLSYSDSVTVIDSTGVELARAYFVRKVDGEFG